MNYYFKKMIIIKTFKLNGISNEIDEIFMINQKAMMNLKIKILQLI